ncbi:hypothetical protein LJC32_02515 [Oscillospiraceae bacterium OttesenSCG-928-F05]|nr:hypothetical protein [Oscillospiraceae bacterium OttesenSCG-928-F05]
MIRKSNSFLELADNLDLFLDSITKENNRIELYETLYRSLMLSSSRFNHLNYQVFEKEDITPPYLLTNWPLCDTAEDNHQYLRDIVKQIRDRFRPSSSIGITEGAIHQIMNHVEQRFGYCSSVLKHNPLRIIISEDSYKDGNSLVMSLLVSKEHDHIAQNDAVILTHLNGNIAPEFVFLHELGHILHLRITQRYDLYTPPRSFDLILEKMFPGAVNKSDSVKAELFAECFAIAALYQSDYSRYDHVDFMSDENKLFNRSYFSALLKTYEQNHAGKLSWEEVFEKAGTMPNI